MGRGMMDAVVRFVLARGEARSWRGVRQERQNGVQAIALFCQLPTTSYGPCFLEQSRHQSLMIPADSSRVTHR